MLLSSAVSRLGSSCRTVIICSCGADEIYRRSVSMRRQKQLADVRHIDELAIKASGEIATAAVSDLLRISCRICASPASSEDDAGPVYMQ